MWKYGLLLRDDVRCNRGPGAENPRRSARGEHPRFILAPPQLNSNISDARYLECRRMEFTPVHRFQLLLGSEHAFFDRIWRFYFQ